MVNNSNQSVKKIIPPYPFDDVCYLLYLNFLTKIGGKNLLKVIPRSCL